MSRSALLICAALLLGGCKQTATTEPVGSRAGEVAATEAKPNIDSPSSHSIAAPRNKPAKALIAVATTNASEAQPCERVCGSLGDCLLADQDYTTAAAGSLEIACLDMCVHAVDSAPAKTEFLACGSQTECGQLQACAEQSWTALALARTGPTVAGVTAPSVDSCAVACTWVYSCLQGGPPGEVQLDPQLERNIDDCTAQCQQSDASDRDELAKWPPCLANHCSLEGVIYCLEESRK